MSRTTLLIAETVSDLVDEEGISQKEIGKIVGRSQAYASTRIKGLQAWTTDDLDAIAKHFGFPNAFGLLDKVRGLDTPLDAQESDTRNNASDEDARLARTLAKIEDPEQRMTLAAYRDPDKGKEDPFDNGAD